MRDNLLSNKRQDARYQSSFPIQISLGSQITLEGQLKDLSLKSAFIKIKSNIYMQPNDQLDFVIRRSFDKIEENIQGQARISRIALGEGIAIYFTKLDEDSAARLKELVNGR
jgi:hypothetical protein